MAWGSGTWGSSPWGGDLPPPVGGAITYAKSRDLKHVRIAFASGVHVTALKPAFYTLVAQSVPAYDPAVRSVRFLNGRGIILNSLLELILENDLSPGVVYQLTIDGVTSLPFSQANFIGHTPNWPPTRSFELWDFVPDINKAEDQSEHLQKFMLCMQDQLDTTLASIDNWTDILDSDRAPEPFLDKMLADLANPFAFEDLGENDKRLLLRVLVQIYKLKGTDNAIRDAVRLFMGFESQINLYRESGSLLGNAVTIIDLLHDSFVLGGGGPFDFALTVAPTEPAGRALTAVEATRIERIVNVVKPAGARFTRPVFYGLVAPDSVQIAGNSSAVTISWSEIEQEPTNWRVYLRLSVSGVSPFNSARYVEVAGSVTGTTISTPIGSDAAGSTYFFVLVPYYNGREGFRSEIEVRNNLPAPGNVVATPGVRSVALTWDEVAAATSYRVYKTLSTTSGSSVPVIADFVFDVLGGDTTFTDTNLLPGQTVHYCVVGRRDDSEGFFSSSVSGTAT